MSSHRVVLFTVCEESKTDLVAYTCRCVCFSNPLFYSNSVRRKNRSFRSVMFVDSCPADGKLLRQMKRWQQDGMFVVTIPIIYTL